LIGSYVCVDSVSEVEVLEVFMHSVYLDYAATDDRRRQLLYEGQVLVFSPRPSVLALCDFAQSMVEAAFNGMEARRAQFEMPVEQFVSVVAPLKPAFIHHPTTKQLIRQILEEFECSLSETYQDVPRLRAVTSDGYLTSGVGYAHHPHRDTWYSAPFSQLNWWIPIYDIESESSMAFHPQYWSQPVRNGSSSFNYYRWNSEGRKDASKHITSDTREQPKPLEPIDTNPQIRIVAPRGSTILFSAAQLHSTVPNTSGLTRFSIDFRTINIKDVIARAGAPNIDSACTGTSLRDFVRSSDLSQMPEDIVTAFDSDSRPDDGMLVFRPEGVSVGA